MSAFNLQVLFSISTKLIDLFLLPVIYEPLGGGLENPIDHPSQLKTFYKHFSFLKS